MRKNDRDLLDYEVLKARAKSLGWFAKEVIVTGDDPFQLTPADINGAQWFEGLWKEFGNRPGMHLRRLHYALLSRARMPDGSDYQNSKDCFRVFMVASRHARYRGVVPAEVFEDRRNSDPFIRLPNWADDAHDAEIETEASTPDLELAPDMPPTPRLSLERPVIAQAYHVEIWCEKTTINDILEPLAEEYGLNVITGAGDLSLTHCVKLVERARRSGLPVRILYVADFDPKGWQMAIGAARKIEHRLYQLGFFGLDIQVRIVALTQEQCDEYALPRNMIKDSDTAKGRFEEEHGEGATELDAMEALYPGQLGTILREEIERYYDADLEDNVAEVAQTVEDQLDEINSEVDEQYAPELEKLEADYRKINAAYDKARRVWEQKAKVLYQRMSASLNERSPDGHAFDWPEPDEGDEDEDPMFDSKRDYWEQIKAYKRYQKKPMTGRKRRTVADDDTDTDAED